MNPFTRFLSRGLRDEALAAFIERWDALEGLVIRVYRGQAAEAEDEAEYRALRGWLERQYPRWQAALRPYWRQAQVAGKAAERDPFSRLLEARTAADFVGDWEAMQHLPAAREALNQLVLNQT